MADLEKAIAYVQHHGTLVEQAQLRYVLTGSTVSPEICAAFLKDQRPDGSWSAFWAPHAASIDATCYHLIQAEYMGLLAPMHPALARAIMFLQQRQSAEEYWEEDVQLRDVAPPWAMPGDLAAILYLTANCGFCLARLALPEGRWHSPLLRTYPVARCESLVLSRSIRTGLPRLFVPAKAPGRRCLSREPGLADSQPARCENSHEASPAGECYTLVRTKAEGRWTLGKR